MKKYAPDEKNGFKMKMKCDVDTNHNRESLNEQSNFGYNLVTVGSNGTNFVEHSIKTSTNVILQQCFLVTIIIGIICTLSWSAFIQGEVVYSCFGICLLIVIIYWFGNRIVSETILVLKSIGIQLTTKTLFHRSSTVYIPIDDVKDIVINEIISMHQVHFILVMLLKDLNNSTGSSLQVVPLFMVHRPKLCHLKTIYQGIQHALR